MRFSMPSRFGFERTWNAELETQEKEVG